MNPSSVFHVCMKRLLALAAFAVPPAMGQSATRLVFEDVPAVVAAGEAFTVTLRAFGLDGRPATNATGGVTLAAERPGAGPRVWITEVNPSERYVEVANLGRAPADLAGWELRLAGSQGTWQTFSRLRLPAGTVLGPGESFLWRGQGTPPGQFPEFVGPDSWTWNSQPVLIELHDAKGSLADQVNLNGPVRELNSRPLRWRQQPLIGAAQPGRSWQRQGIANHFAAGDWFTNAPTPFVLPPTLRQGLEASPESVAFEQAPAGLVLSNGVVQATLRVPEPGENVRLVAESPAGILTRSAALGVAARGRLALVLPEEFVEGALPDHAPGRVELAVPAAADLVVRLEASPAGTVTVPAEVVIPAGQSTASFVVTSVDDGDADGTTPVRVTARAAGHASATAVVLQHDDEAGRVVLDLPLAVSGGEVHREGSGWTHAPGRVVLGAPAVRDVLVTLLSEDARLVGVPSRVVVPAGSTMAEFPVLVGDDGLLALVTTEVIVRAEVRGWPPAEAALAVGERGPAPAAAQITLVASPEIVEGTPGFAELRLAQPAREEIRARLTRRWEDRPTGLQFPAEIIVPAGSSTGRVEITRPDDSAYLPGEGVVLVAVVGDSVVGEATIRAFDDEIAPAHISVVVSPQPLRPNQPIQLDVILSDATGWPQRWSGDAVLSLTAADGFVAWSGAPPVVRLTNGVWQGTVSVAGEASQVWFQVTAAGVTGMSLGFDLVDARPVDLRVSDFAADPDGHHLWLAGYSEDSPWEGWLKKLDPATGETLRSVTLPQRAARLWLTDDGRRAYFSLTDHSLGRMDLEAGRLDTNYFIPPPPDLTSGIWDVLPLPGRPDDLAVLVYGPRPQLTLFRGTNAAPQSLDVPFVAYHGLTRGRNGGELFVSGDRRLARVAVGAEGLSWAADVEYPPDTARLGGNLAWAGDRLWSGSGEVLDPATLQMVSRLQGAGWCLPEPERQTAYFFSSAASSLRGVTAVDVATGQPRSTLHFANSIGDLKRSARWGTNGLAALLGDQLHLVRTGLVPQTGQQADLVVQLEAPAVQLLGSNAVWTVTVSNRGPERVDFGTVELELPDNVSVLPARTVPLGGPLAAGAAREFRFEVGTGWPEVVAGRVRVTGSLPDPNPADNMALGETAFTTSPPGTPFAQLMLGAVHLAASPDGSRLYATQARPHGGPQEGVAVIDPATATVERVLPVGSDPRRAAVSSDGRFLHVVRGSNVVTRWNLADGRADLEWNAPEGEAIQDLLALPGEPEAVVLATSRRIRVLDRAQPRSREWTFAAGPAFIDFVGSPRRLALARPGSVRLFTVDAQGLTPDGPSRPLALFSENYRFTGSSNALWSEEGRFDLASGLLERQDDLAGAARALLPDTGQLLILRPTGELSLLPPGGGPPLRSQPVPVAGSSEGHLVRWGVDGIAYLGRERAVHLARAGVPADGTTSDLGIVIESPSPLLVNRPATWRITVTNHGPTAVGLARVRLEIGQGRLEGQDIQPPPSANLGPAKLIELGTLEAGGSRVITLTGTSISQESFRVTATVWSASVDPVAANDAAEATAEATYPAADIVLTPLQAPTRVQAGEEFTARLEVRNLGGVDVEELAIFLPHPSGLELVRAEPGELCTNCFSDTFSLVIGPLARGADETVILRWRAVRPGLADLRAWAEGAFHRPDRTRPTSTAVVSMSPPADPGAAYPVVLPDGPLGWDSSGTLLLQAVQEGANVLVAVDPATFEVRKQIPLPGHPVALAVSPEGREAYVWPTGPDILRLDVESGAVLARHAAPEQVAPGSRFAVKPGDPAVLIHSYPRWTGPPYVGFDAYRNGVRLTHPLPPGDVPYAIAFRPDGRLLAARPGFLRAFEVTGTALVETENLDHLAPVESTTMTWAKGLICYGDGRIADPLAGFLDHTLYNGQPTAADPVTGLLYRTAGGPPGAVILEAFDLATRSLAWRQTVPATINGPTAPVALGDFGVLVPGQEMALVRLGLLPERQADLQLSTLNAGPLATGPGGTLSAGFAVTNLAIWPASNVTLRVMLPAGLVLLESQPPAAVSNRVAVLRLGDLAPGGLTNATLTFTALASGPAPLEAAAESASGEANPADNRLSLPFTVWPPPNLLITDQAVAEGNSSTSPPRLTARLSGPRDAEVRIPFTVEPVTATADDLDGASGELVFPADRDVAGAALPVRGDLVFEPDETIRVTLHPPATVTASATNVLVTLLNDDWPMLNVTGRSVREGQAGVTNLAFRVTLNPAAAVPVTADYEIAGLTAADGTDFMGFAGRLRFQPGQSELTVNVGVLGDTEPEADETLGLWLADAPLAAVAGAFALGTILNDDGVPAPRLALTSLAGGAVGLEWTALAGLRYDVERRGALGTNRWQQVGRITAAGARAFWNDSSPPAGEGYYRIRVAP
jgi:DNA-binding beta-propeller fold protein YncE